MPVPLVVIESPYRETVRPVLRYVRQLRREYPGDVISIVIPEYVVAHWWEHLLHNQTALRLKGRLLFEPVGCSHQRALRARRAGGRPVVMNDPVTYIRSEDMLDESAPKRLARGLRPHPAAPAPGLALGGAIAAAGDPAVGRARRRARPRRPGARLPVRGGRDRDRRRGVGRGGLRGRLGDADQLLFRRSRSTPSRSATPTRSSRWCLFVVVAVLVSGSVEFAVRRAQAAERARAEAETIDGAHRPRARGGGVAARGPCAGRGTPSGWSRWCSRRFPVAGDEWHDVEHVGWAPEGEEAPLRFDVPVGPRLRLLGRGPALFAEDRRVLDAFANAARTAYEGPAAERRGRAGALPRGGRRAADVAAGGCRPRLAHTARRDQGRGQQPAPDRRRVVRRRAQRAAGDDRGLGRSP